MNYGWQRASDCVANSWSFYWLNTAISSCHGASGLLEAGNHSSAHRLCRAGRDLVLEQARAGKINLNWQLSMAKVSPAQFVRQVRQEASRISWASRRETGTATLTVFVMVAIAAVFFLLVDMVLSNVVQFVLGLGG